MALFNKKDAMLPFFHPHQKIPLFLIAFIALAHSFAFMIYQQPDWETQWTDQGGYHQLASSLAFHGVFTRFPGTDPFVPEVIRTPGYPLFVALLYRVFGPSHWVVATAQAMLFSIICLFVYRLAQEVTTPRVALAAAATTAIFPPIPYYGALILTEIWTTLLVTAGLVLLVGALGNRSTGRFAAAGVVLGYAGLTRPIFYLLPAFLVTVAAVALTIKPKLRDIIRPAALGVFLSAYLLTMAPWFAYNYYHFHKLTIAPAGGIGRSSWEGYWNGKFPGRTQTELTKLAESPLPDEELDRQVQAVPGFEPAMLSYVHQWREIRRQYTVTPDAPAYDRVFSRVKADAIFGRFAQDNIASEPIHYLIRRFTYGMFVLWAGEIPIRYSDINQSSSRVIHILWAAQVALLFLAALGAFRLWRSKARLLAVLLLLPPIYLSLVQWPFLTESRYSLPLKPALLLLAVLGLDWLLKRFAKHRAADRST
jgi:4-amino-4-deoxy-L-arabinose transferase-like glycosyltransferase